MSGSPVAADSKVQSSYSTPDFVPREFPNSIQEEVLPEWLNSESLTIAVADLFPEVAARKELPMIYWVWTPSKRHLSTRMDPPTCTGPPVV
jgi:hypothetical protein